MGKLVIKSRGNKVADVVLKLGEMTIGRSPACDIVLSNDKSVSNKHAAIKTVGRQLTLVDLDSTNGTFIDTERVTKHELRHGEIIVIGEHELIYRDDVALEASTFGSRPATSAALAEDAQEKTKIIAAFAQLHALEGKDKGKRVPLVKEETVLDNPGKNPARIYRTPDGYVLSAQLGPGEPRLNDKPVQPGGQLLASGDIIEITGAKYQFVK